MNVVELLDAAKTKTGSLSEVAKRLGKNSGRISEWRSGKTKPDSSEVAYLADMAGLPILETVAEVEREIRPQYADIWLKAASLAGVTKS